MPDLELTPKQRAILTSQRPYRAFIGGVRSGKTHVGGIDCVLRALEAPPAPGVFTLATSNTYDQVRDVLLPAIQRGCNLLGVTYTYHASSRTFILENGSPIICKALSAPNPLRGIEVGHWWGDEVRDYTPDAIAVCLERQSAKDAQCGFLWTTTPAGYGPIHQHFVRDADPDLHFMVQATTYENEWINPKFADNIARAFKGTPELLEQELLGQFTSLKGTRCYKPFDRKKHASKRLQYRPTLPNQWGEQIPVPLYLMIDWNVNPLVCEVGQETERDGRGLPILDVICEIVRRNSWVDDLADAIIKKFGRHPGPVVINGDGKETGRDVQSGKTTYDLLEMRLRNVFPRLEVRVQRRNPPPVDRVNSVNFMLAHDRMRVDPSCTMLIDDFETVSWDRETQQIDKTDLERTHASDSVGYRCWLEHRPTFFNPEFERLGGGL